MAYDDADGFLTERVLACPPTECLAVGCPGHELYVKGLAGCGVDTNAPVGTSFNITFTVFDSHRPSATASLVRKYTIVSPCSPGEVYCPELTTQCGTAPCTLRAVSDSLNAVDQVPAPDIQIDLSRAPVNSVHFDATLSGRTDTSVGLREHAGTLRVYGVCGKRMPVNAASVCGTSSSKTCGDGIARCPLRLQALAPDQDSTPEPVVSFSRTVAGPCRAGFEGCTECSLPSIAAGLCEPSTQAFVAHATDSSGQEGAGILLEATVVPAVASATLDVQITLSSS